jgi:hypothetical protein
MQWKTWAGVVRGQVMSGHHLRNESLAVAPDVPLRFKRATCETCKELQLFRGMKCLKCGTLMKFITPRGQVARYEKKKHLSHYINKTFSAHQRVNADKKAYYEAKRKAQAEASRLKFEGPK